MTLFSTATTKTYHMLKANVPYGTYPCFLMNSKVPV